MVAPVELDDERASRETARKTHRAHRGLGARRHHARHLGARHERAYALGQAHLGFAGRAERQPALHLGAHRLENRGRAMPEDHRPP